MPVLAFLLLGWRIEAVVFLHLDDKADLSGVAEVGDSEGAHFVDERLPCQLHLVLSLLDQVLYLVRLELHNASNAELARPLTLVEVAQDVFQIDGLLARIALSFQIKNQLVLF